MGMGGMKKAGAREKYVPSMALLVDWRRRERERDDTWILLLSVVSIEGGQKDGWMDGI